MHTSLFILWIAVAGAAVLWRTWLNDRPHWKKVLAAIPHRLGKMLTCGSCFTYWLSLAAVIIFDPLAAWHPPLRMVLPVWTTYSIVFALSWMAVAWGALTARFGYVALQEYVAGKVHAHEGHAHTPH